MAKEELIQTERHLPLIAVGTDGTGTGLLQVDKQLGVMNGRLYRQARSYRVRFTGMSATANEHMYQFYTLPSTYDTVGAIRLAYKNWLNSISTELDGGATMGKWYDFRISPETISADNSDLTACMFNGDTWGVLAADGYEYSSAQGSDGNAKGFHIGLDVVSNSFNIYREWTDHLSNQQDDSLTTTVQDVYPDLTAGDEHETRTHLGETGDRSPYDMDRQTIRDGAFHLVMKDSFVVDQTAGGSNARSVTFDAPLGIVVVRKLVNQSESDFSTSVTELTCIVSPGSYKGVYAPAIVDFNPRALEQ